MRNIHQTLPTQSSKTKAVIEGRKYMLQMGLEDSLRA